MMQRRQLISALPVWPAFIALSGTVLAPLASAAPAQAGEAVTWPEVQLLDGTRWAAQRTRGKAVVVVFWSTTCPFCLRHNAHITKLQQKTAGTAFEILTVARERDPVAVQRYLDKHGYGFAVTLDHAPMSAALSTRRMIPLTVTVGRDGRLRQVIPGEMSEDDVMDLPRALA